MKHGFIKVAAATPKIKVADCLYNANEIIAIINQCENKGVKLLVLPELSVTGYTAGDLFYQETLLNSTLKALSLIQKASEKYKMLIFVGMPLRYLGKIYNAAVALSEGKVLGAVPKTYIPNYNEFYEKRHFAGALPHTVTVNINGAECPMGTDILFRSSSCENFIVGTEICEDLWVISPPSERHAEAGASIIVNLSSSNEAIGKSEYRRLIVKSQSGRLNCGYVYASSGDGESTTDMVFSGHNIIAENGVILKESELFKNGCIISEIDVSAMMTERSKLANYHGSTASHQTVYFDSGFELTELTREYPAYPFVPNNPNELSGRAELILTMQAQGLKKRIEHINAKTAVIGISGGLDSSLALIAAIRAMKLLRRSPKDVHGITMPCFGTSDRTYQNALRLADAMGITFLKIDIGEAVKAHLKDIGHDINIRDTAYENAQARERTQVLMDYANMTGGLVIGTGDLSELALGWATYNGDHMSMYGVNSSVPKTLVKFLIRYEAEKTGGALLEVLNDILSTPISPELLPTEDGKIAQKTEDLVGPYALHDFFLYYMIRMGFPPSKIYRLATRSFQNEYDSETIKKWLKVFITRFFAQQFKRSCLPDGVKIGSVTLSPRSDWRMPSDASAEAWLSELSE